MKSSEMISNTQKIGLYLNSKMWSETQMVESKLAQRFKIYSSSMFAIDRILQPIHHALHSSLENQN